MNRIMIPFCVECSGNYQIGSGVPGKFDLHGPKIPMLLHCGHDLCRRCLNTTYRRTKRISCKVCSFDIKVEHEDYLYNIPVHYYLVGKVLYLSTNKQQQMFREMASLKMTNVPGESMKKNKKICDKCQKYSDFFCQQCDEAFCKKCFYEIHKEGQYQHDVEKLDNSHPEFFTESQCDQHLKLIDFICVTCQLHVCSICAINDHRPHDIQHLGKYNLDIEQNVNEYTVKGDNLLKKLKYYKNGFHDKAQKYQNVYSKNKIKIDSPSSIRQHLQNFITSLIGTLQSKELMILNKLDQAEFTDINSIKKLIGQLSEFIDVLQVKLNTVDLLMKNNQHSTPEMKNTIDDIDNMVKKTYCIAKKNQIKPSYSCQNSIYENIQNCVTLELDTSDTYILTDSLELPQNYILSDVINVNCTDEEDIFKRPTSSNSSISTMSSDCDVHNDVTNAQLMPQSQLDRLSIKGIKKNDVEPVTITHINSPSDFYLHLIANDSVMTTITNELYKFIHTEQSFTHCIKTNNAMYAVKCSDNKWRRGVVINIQEGSGTTIYTVQCIDYGFLEILTASRIRSLPTTIICIPPLAYNCALYKLKPSLITGWSNEAYTLFSELMTAKSGSYFVYPMNVDEDRIEVDMVWKEYFYPLSIRDAMFFLGHGSSECYINNELHEKLINTITLPEPYKLTEGEEYSVVLNHFNSPNEFYLRINDENCSILMDIMELLNTIYKPTEIDTHKSYLLYTPRIGMAVAARYSLDGHWYRAKIISLPEPRMVTVFYIDFGNSETLPWDQLRVLDKKLIEIPPLAIKSLLTDIIPAVDGIESTTWSDNACAVFMDLLEGSKSDNNLSALIHKINGNVHKVVLYNHTSRGEVCINRKLISLGLATTLDPATCIFHKRNARKPYPIQAPIQMNIRTSKIKKQSSEDTLVFHKKKLVTENEHTWEQTNKNIPGIQMSIVKVVSPDEIILKYLDHDTTKLTDRLNKFYNDKKKKHCKKLDWKINDLCVVIIKKFGNWYRGKISKLDTVKNQASVYFYDINETYEEIPIKKLYVLETIFMDEKCAFIHCCMDKLVPLGASDGKWPEYTCDRLIELLKNYSLVYFARKGRKNNIDFGEIWVKEIDKPQALEPICERWININRYMIEQGFALSAKQNKKDDDHNSNTPIELEFSTTFETYEHSKPVNSWLPHPPIINSSFEAIPTFIDFQCLVYLQIKNDETSELLKYISAELNSLYFNSKPEPTNYKWTKGQMVIAKYFLDDLWYRATILEESSNGEYSVQFLDFGNIENCSRENLRSNLYNMATIPKLCFVGYFNSIKPLTKNEKWSIPTLDFIHTLIVDTPCTCSLDLNVSSDTLYAIRHMKNKYEQDICQYLVTSGYAFFNYVDEKCINLVDFEDMPKANLLGKSEPIKSFQPIAENTESEEEFDHSFNDESSSIQSFFYEIENDDNDDDDDSIHNTSYKVENDDDCTLNTSHKVEHGNIHSTSSEREVKNTDGVHVVSSECEIKNYGSVSNVSSECEMKNEDWVRSADMVKVSDSEDECGYLKFSLETSEVFEGTLCRVTGPTNMTLMIMKIGGVDIGVSKDTMQRKLYEICTKLPALHKIIPGSAVTVLYQILWRRGIISKDGNSVHLVDLGISIKLTKKNLRICPVEFLELPMFSIRCQLVNVRPNENADTNDIVKEMTKLLKNINLKITGISELDDDIFGVELYNDKDEIAYQPLIDSGLLIVNAK